MRACAFLAECRQDTYFCEAGCTGNIPQNKRATPSESALNHFSVVLPGSADWAGANSGFAYSGHQRTQPCAIAQMSSRKRYKTHNANLPPMLQVALSLHGTQTLLRFL
ncbi:hypothetical protein KCP75_05145 [Salmonella enterica subsp. enterica]|nr:hypothetical protein KCP75_05145 [Salmonella enterica subsp. enterica]